MLTTKRALTGCTEEAKDAELWIFNPGRSTQSSSGRNSDQVFEHVRAHRSQMEKQETTLFEHVRSWDGGEMAQIRAEVYAPLQCVPAFIVSWRNGKNVKILGRSQKKSRLLWTQNWKRGSITRRRTNALGRARHSEKSRPEWRGPGLVPQVMGPCAVPSGTLTVELLQASTERRAPKMLKIIFMLEKRGVGQQCWSGFMAHKRFVEYRQKIKVGRQQSFTHNGGRLNQRIQRHARRKLSQ